jgi:amino acid transporter
VRRLWDEPELKRTLGSFQVFAVSVAFISVAVGIFGTYDDVLQNAWPVVGFDQTMIAALVIAQFAARIPLSAPRINGRRGSLIPISGGSLGGWPSDTCARMVFAMSRDAHLPAHRLMRWVSPRTHTPIPATILIVLLVFVLASPPSGLAGRLDLIRHPARGRGLLGLPAHREPRSVGIGAGESRCLQALTKE